MTDTHVRDVVIIGSGPAGYTAASTPPPAQAPAVRQQRLRRRLADHHDRGGELPGFPGGVDGPVLMENMRAQAEMIDDDIVSVDLSRDIKLFTVSVGTVHRARTV